MNHHRNNVNSPQHQQQGKALKVESEQGHHWGVYENLPDRRLPNGPMSNNTSLKSSNDASLMSGGVNRNTRARSEKREMVDSWFSKSFANAGGLNQSPAKNVGCGNNEHYECESRDNGNGNNNTINAESDEFGSFIDRKRAFENLIAQTKQSSSSSSAGCNIPAGANVNSGRIQASMSPSPGVRFQSTPTQKEGNGSSSSSGRRSMPYRGCKTTSNVDEAGDWDFLSTLNDILREENFIGDSYLEDNQNSFERKKDATTTVTVTPTISDNGTNSSSPANPNYGTNNVPLSPRPPRPARRAERRREYAKARSMDIAHLASNANIHGGNNLNDYSYDQSTSVNPNSLVSTVPSPRNVIVETSMTSIPMNMLSPPNYQQYSQPTQNNGSGSNGGVTRCVSPYQNVPSSTVNTGTNDLSMMRRMDSLPLQSSCASSSTVPIHQQAACIPSTSTGNKSSSGGTTLLSNSRPMTPCGSREPHQMRMIDNDPIPNNGPRPPMNSPPLNPTRLPPPPVMSPLLQANPMSSSLDSIYDKLKASSEYVDPVTGRISPAARPVTQLYEGGGGGNHGMTLYDGRCPPMNPMYFNGYGNYYNSSTSNPNVFGSGRFHPWEFEQIQSGGWKGSNYFYNAEFDCMVDRHGYPIVGPRQSLNGCDNNNKGIISPSFGGGMVKGGGGGCNTGSLPRLWNKMPEYRSRSYGSLKVT
jgi:hypothetical protein